VDAAFGQFSALAVRFRRPVALAVLTVEDLKQARARAGGDKGDAGAFAMRAALRTLDTMRQVREEAKR
jgi:6,7-dimethyl-8-ribityllumazine synthase